MALALCSGCGGGTPIDSASGGAGGPPLDAEAAQASQAIGASLSRLINEATARYRPLDYEYDEDLLTKLDQIDSYLSNEATGPAPRFLAKLGEQEEVDHFRETIRRWQAKTGKSLRTEVDKLKAEVDARKPGGQPFHPEFHKRFSAAFDELIRIEVEEIRERKNRYLHEEAKSAFDQYREKYPAVVREHEDFLNKPPYAPPAARARRQAVLIPRGCPTARCHPRARDSCRSPFGACVSVTPRPTFAHLRLLRAEVGDYALQSRAAELKHYRDGGMITVSMT